MTVSKTILVGNAGSDPEVRYTQNGKAVCNFTLATSKRYNNEDHTEWHRIILWNKTAEIAGEHVKKGAKLYLEGENRTRKWQDNQGNDRWTTEVVCHTMQFLGAKTDSGATQQRNNAQGNATPQGAPQNTPQVMREPDFELNDDIPF